MNELDKEKDLELDDLLISNSDEEETKGSQGKKIILLGAVAIVLFAIIIVVFYMLQDDKKPVHNAVLETAKPIEKVEVNTPVSSLPKEPSDFGQMPIDNQNQSSDEQFQKIIDQIKAQQKEQAKTPVASNETQKPKEPVRQEQTIQTPKQDKPVQNIQKPATPSESFKDIQTNDPKIQGSEATTGFYVQVGSFSKFSPNKQLLETITQSNFSYRMQKAGDNNRLLIGPFATKKEAQDKLSEIKDRINKDAFIKEIK
ncbi:MULTISPECIES: SPOR domain-containing protein [Helicobacter]|uniref:SPOR domain-containing protein n=1 Tax=Helicobacter ibis TaxID=2962633 RepID=A0ABT4VCL8_9HELI|nr:MULTISPECIES: SPOR domain-containing protein [Helicobacter]MDA3966779.1 SPOR domain-containing protein [Helicobacter sp. WB40]MDA3968439.1 SPOR domain-containing protein [Helicobacter ibis]